MSGTPSTGTTGIEERDGQRVFVKRHDDPPHRLLEFEAVGLRALRGAGARVPEVLETAPTRLVTQLVPGPAASRTPAQEEQFGRELAALHRTTRPASDGGGEGVATVRDSARPGGSTDGVTVEGISGYGAIDGHPVGWLGACDIDLTPCDTWAESLIEKRVVPLARQAAGAGALDPAGIDLAERLTADALGPAEPPTLVHGDLWAGNRMVDDAGCSWLIDPSAQYGHREQDLAMMQLFGGFTERELAAYCEAFPPTDGWRERIGTHQLVPLLVHAILFGGGYGSQAMTVLRRAVR
ncbi:fructosamine kinase family protein [Kytococcus sp. Marseille-QA3725]